MNSLRLIASQWDNALAIAFLGLMQTVIISRSIAYKSGQTIITNREIIGQGLANSIAPFISAFAGSGSFNRSATNYQAGAKTPIAGIFGVVFLFLIVLLGHSFLSLIPKAVISATLFLVGVGLLDIPQIREIWVSSAERWIFIITFVSSIILGLNVGVLVGIFSSLIVYLWHTSQPNIDVAEYLSRNGKLVKSLSIDGNLFFGSLPVIEKAISKTNAKNSILLIKTDHITYLDIPAARMILKILEDSISQNREVYVYISRDPVLQMLQSAGLSEIIKNELLIFKDKNHSMKSILFPFQTARSDTMTEITDLNVLTEQIRKTMLMNSFSDESVDLLLKNNPPRYAAAGEIIIRQDEDMNDHFILIDGEIEVQRTWSVADGNDKSHTWTLSPQNEIPATLAAASNGIRVRALSDLQYVLLDAVTMDSLLGWINQESLPKQESGVFKLMQRIVTTHHFPKETLEKIVSELKTQKVEEGQVIIREREKGESYYFIEEGEAEVIRSDPFTDEIAVVAHLEEGDCFGEEALIQDGYRNATVKMLSPGRLQVLNKNAFEDHVQPGLIKEINAEEAYKKLESNEVELLDCRYDMEYEDSRIPNATLIPLHELRDRVHELDSAKSYLVYCRSGKRSKAAAYLLQERNINGVSISGGIKDWPYEVIFG